jgi:hypothetical protein
MNLDEVIKALNLKVLTNGKDFSSITPEGGYTSDLLSCVMAGASHKSIWVTLQAHTNIVAVAALLELSAIIITEGASPDQITIDKANEEGIVLLSSQERSFNVVGSLWEMGIRGN